MHACALVSMHGCECSAFLLSVCLSAQAFLWVRGSVRGCRDWSVWLGCIYLLANRYMDEWALVCVCVCVCVGLWLCVCGGVCLSAQAFL